jgi:hypothetical protein
MADLNLCFDRRYTYLYIHQFFPFCCLSCHIILRVSHRRTQVISFSLRFIHFFLKLVHPLYHAAYTHTHTHTPIALICDRVQFHYHLYFDKFIQFGLLYIFVSLLLCKDRISREPFTCVCVCVCVCI